MQSRSTFSKYQLGLRILGGLVLLLTIYVIIQGVSSRQDAITDAKAQSIADTLNSYTDSKALAPASLASLGIKNVPSTISYHKLTDDSYQFCATYKSASDGVSATGLEDVVSAAALSSLPNNTIDMTPSAGTATSLVIGSHKKGKNCQKVSLLTAGLQSDGSGSSSSSDSSTSSGSTGSDSGDNCTYDYSKSDADNTAYYACINSTTE